MGPKKLVSKLFLISSVGVSSIGPVIPTPALFITISILFDKATTFSTAFLILSTFRTSSAIKGNIEFDIFSGFLLVP